MAKSKKDKDLIAHVSLFGATVLDRILDNKPLPFLPGGPIEMKETLGRLIDTRLIVTSKDATSGYRLTQMGKDVCYALWGEKAEPCPWPMMTQESEYDVG